MMRSSYSSVGEIQEEIVARNERISLSQVSKVLSAMEADLVIDKTSGNIRLIQPEKLLDLLVEGYCKPKVLGSLRISEQPTPKFLDYLGKKAKAAGTSIAVYDPKRYVVGPESDDLLEIYVRASSATDLEQLFDITPSDRFVKAEIKAVADAGLFLDAFKEKSGIGWCSNLEVYLRLMQGGKRARETAAELRNDIIGTTRARMQN